jgi:hypothetical protein
MPLRLRAARNTGMGDETPFAQISEGEYSLLLQLLSATKKGRAFLAEVRRRSRPEDIQTLRRSLQLIQQAMTTLRDQLQPARVADELREIAMTLEFATEGVIADPEGTETARRMALVNRARSELSALAGTFAGELAPVPSEIEPAPAGRPETFGDDFWFQPHLKASAAVPER